MPQINFITPQSFDIKIQEEDTFQAFGTFNTEQGYTGIWYTSAYDALNEEWQNGQFGHYFPSPSEYFLLRYVLNKYLVNDGVNGETECATTYNGDIINDQIASDCDSPTSQCEFDENGFGYCQEGLNAGLTCMSNDDCPIQPVTNIFDSNACCINTIRLQTCDSDNFGDANIVPFKKWDYGTGDWEPEGCNFGQILAVGPPWPSNNISTLVINATAGRLPYGMNNLASNSDVAASAGYDTNSGVYQGEGLFKYDRITLLDNGRYRRGNSYCDKYSSSHMDGVSFTCPGDSYDEEIGYTDYVDTYGNYYITYDEDSDLNSIIFENDRTWGDGQYNNGTGVTTFQTNDSNQNGMNIISSNENIYGNPCVNLMGTGEKYNGKAFTWDTIMGTPGEEDYNCVNVGENASDVGFDLLIPQGSGAAVGDTPYNGLIPTHGLKVLKSYYNDAYGEYPGILWYDRDISIYYLASDGRYMTEAGSVGTYELNRKDETLILNGITKSAYCDPDDSIEDIEECVNSGHKWYPDANTKIVIDRTGFQDGILKGTIKTKSADYFDNNCDFPPCSQVDYGSVGEIKTLPAKFASSNIWQGTYGNAGNNVATFYINSDDVNSHMSLIRHNTSGDSGADFGYSMVRTLVGTIGENPVDSWTNFLGGNTIPGDAWGWATYKTFYGYGYDYLYAAETDIPWDPINGAEEDIWRYKEVAHRFLIGNTLVFTDDNPDNGFPYDTISDVGNVDLDHQMFSPTAPCDNVDVSCQGNLLGTITNDNLSTNTSFLLSGDLCDVNASSSTIVCDGPGNPYPQCDDAGEVVNICIGCTDPSAINYCIPFGCTYSDFSCEYDVSPPDGDSFVKCDGNGDGTVNILDIVIGINFILSQDIDSFPYAYNLDYNEDGTLNVLDIVSCINEIMDNSTLSSSDEALLRQMKSTLKHPNGVKQSRKLATRAGYDIHKVRDYVRLGKKNRHAAKSTKKHQFHKLKSNKVLDKLSNGVKQIESMFNVRRKK